MHHIGGFPERKTLPASNSDISRLTEAGLRTRDYGLLPLRNGLHAFQLSRCVSFERFRVDYKNRLTFPKYSNDSAISSVENCCHSLDIAPKRLLFPSMFSAITADNGDYIGFAVGFAMYYHTAKLRIPIF